MTDTPPKPNCRRWRWLAVAFAVLMGVWIIQRPTIDPRLVCTWSLDLPGSVVTYFPNGRFRRGDVGTTVELRWHVKNGKLYHYATDENPVIRVGDQLRLLYLKLTGQKYYEFLVVQEIVDVGASEFSVRDETGSVLRYRRISE